MERRTFKTLTRWWLAGLPALAVVITLTATGVADHLPAAVQWLLGAVGFMLFAVLFIGAGILAYADVVLRSEEQGAALAREQQEETRRTDAGVARLRDALVRAETWLAAGPMDDPFASHRPDEILRIVRRGLSELSGGSLSPETHRELWLIFLPTSSFDDQRGDPAVGQEVLDAIEALQGRPTPPK